MLGELISGGMKLLGGMMDREAQEDINKQQIAQAEANRKMQLDFATRGIEWKVNDALRAGVHPLFALGASTHSYSPVNVGLEKASMGSALADMGQDVSRAVSSVSSNAQRQSMAAQNAVILEGLQLDNDIKRAKLASDVQKLSQPSVGSPVPEAGKFEERPKLLMGGTKIGTDPSTTNAEDYEKRYGELSDWIFGPGVLYNDVMGKTEPFFSEVQWNKIRRAIGSLFGIGGGGR